MDRRFPGNSRQRDQPVFAGHKLAGGQGILPRERKQAMNLTPIQTPFDSGHPPRPARIACVLRVWRNWERGITSPSRRMTKRIQEFLDFTPKLIPKIQENSFCCQTCGISNTSSECCLFEKICISFAENKL
jgi:hypothetical protein